MALRSIKVLEFAGLAPVPFCGMLLADFGATVIRVDRTDGGSVLNYDPLSNGKQSIAINLKDKNGVRIIRKLSQSCDVLLDPYRPGVLEKLNLGPSILMADNPRLIYARLTGYGQSGEKSKAAGHDINYLAVSGLLSLMGRKGEKPTFPINLAADFGGGGLLCAYGILAALIERTASGQGQVIDASMVEGVSYLGSWLYRTQNSPIWSGTERGTNLLDGGAPFYDVYETRDGKYMAVGALEPQFFATLLQTLNVDTGNLPQYDSTDPDAIRTVFERIFRTKTQQEWTDQFENVQDACVTPVLTIEDAAMRYPQNVERKSFHICQEPDAEEVYVPKPAPKLSRTPAMSSAVRPAPSIGQHTVDILKDLHYPSEEIAQLQECGAVRCHLSAKL